MFERLKGLLSRKKETPEQREEREKQEILKAMNQHQKGTNALSESLNLVELDTLGMTLQDVLADLQPGREREGIPVEQIEIYRDVIAGLQQRLQDEGVFAMDTSRIDSCIAELVTYFKNAVKRGSEKSASRLLVQISDGILYSRAPFQEPTEERKAAEMIHRADRMDVVAASAELQDLEDQLLESIRDLDEEIAHKEKEKEAAEAELKEFIEVNPKARDMVAIYRKTGEIKDQVLVMQVMTRMKKVTSKKTEASKIAIVREAKSLNREKLDHIRELLQINSYMEDQSISSQLTERMDLILQRNQDAIARKAVQDRIVQELEQRSEAVFDTMLQNLTPELEEILRTYDKEQRMKEKNERQIQEERARALEKEKEKETEADTARILITE